MEHTYVLVHDAAEDTENNILFRGQLTDPKLGAVLRTIFPQEGTLIRPFASGNNLEVIAYGVDMVGRMTDYRLIRLNS